MRRLPLDALLLIAVVYFALPPNPRLLKPPGFVSTTILDRNGVTLREVLSDQDGVARWVPLSEISPNLVMATVCAEDKRFYQHPGVDLLASGRALARNLKAGRITAGGSTITQQLVHNLYRFPRHNVWSKFAEACEALRFEFHLSKSEILEAYLNRVPYANQVFGAEAAARTYLGKSCAELSLAEACLLAAIPRSPSFHDPYRHLAHTQERQQAILLSLMRQQKASEFQVGLARAEKLQLLPKEQNFRAPHFTDWVLATLRRNSVRRPGKVNTTLDLSIQEMVERQLRRNVRTLRGNNVTNGAVIVMKPGTGEILAMAGSVDYFDEQNDGQVNAALARRQPGSALKPFTYELALEDGATAAELLPDLELQATEISGDFMPRNYDEQFHGPVRLRTALACSYNIPAVRVAERVGPDRLLDRLHELGFASLDKPASHYGLALTLGDGEVTLLEMCRAYACLANLGQFKPERITLGGREDDADRRAPVMSEAGAYIITDILADNEARAPAFGPYSVLDLGFACAAKTGTSKDFRDNWTVGFSRDYLVGVWVGNFDGSPMHGVSGVTGAGPLFRDIMFALHSELPSQFVAPDGVVEQQVCPKSGELCSPDCPGGITEKFERGFVPTRTCSVHQRFRVDRATGLLAGTGTPSGETEERIYEVYPPLYYTWMQSAGLPFPPVAIESGNQAEAGDSAQQSLSIVFPNRNSVFKLDPDIGPEFQSLELSAATPAGCRDVSWSVDDTALGTAGPPFAVFWPLKPGRHRIRCEARPQGLRDEVSVLVLR